MYKHFTFWPDSVGLAFLFKYIFFSFKLVSFSTAKDQMVRENNGEVREEISKQLDRSVVKDWDYQLEFKKKRDEEAKLAEMAMAQREKQVLKN